MGACIEAASKHWWALSEKDWLEAFAAHPKIGGVKALKAKVAGTKFGEHSNVEQKGVVGASDKTIEALAAGNKQYEDNFGFIFIVCASGKSADEMLALLQARVNASRDDELKTA